MINNRQGGRRRGRGGQRGQNLGGQPGNRQDNRQRGNAAQLFEKYKNMARDAQLSGDRVQTEYYLQFADHYFRVLSESRARFEEQNPRRHRDEDLEDEDGDEELIEAGEEQGSGDERNDRAERHDRSERYERPERQGRDRPRRRFDRDERSRDEQVEDRQDATQANGGNGSLPLDVLPPAIGGEEPRALPGDEEPAPRPRRRSRASRSAEGEDEIAPTA